MTAHQETATMAMADRANATLRRRMFQNVSVGMGIDRKSVYAGDADRAETHFVLSVTNDKGSPNARQVQAAAFGEELRRCCFIAKLSAPSPNCPRGPPAPDKPVSLPARYTRQRRCASFVTRTRVQIRGADD